MARSESQLRHRPKSIQATKSKDKIVTDWCGQRLLIIKSPGTNSPARSRCIALNLGIHRTEPRLFHDEIQRIVFKHKTIHPN